MSTLFCLCNISNICHLLDRRATAILIHAYVTLCLDNGNALLVGLPEMLLSRLLMGAECIRLPGVPDWSTRPHHPGLTWTALAGGQTEVAFKVLLLTCKTLHGLAPQYLAVILSTRSLPSSYSLLLMVPCS